MLSNSQLHQSDTVFGKQMFILGELEGFVVNCFKTFAIRFRCDSFCWSFQPDHGGTENTEDARRAV